MQVFVYAFGSPILGFFAIRPALWLAERSVNLGRTEGGVYIAWKG